LEVAGLIDAGAVDPDPGPLDPAPDVWPVEPVVPIATPRAGRAIEEPAAEVERLHSASFEWVGGDPAVDQPRVVLQRRSGGSYRNVQLPSGRVLDDRTHRIVLAYRPDPIEAAPDAIERHRYRAWFQVVEDLPSVSHAAGFRTGTYRFRVKGRARRGNHETPYEVFSAPFRVLPTDDLGLADLERDGDVVRGRVVLPPATGYRLQSLATPAGESIPVADAVVRASPGGGEAGTDAEGRFELTVGPGTSELVVEDSFGNRAGVAAPAASSPARR
jgi:hypothetical protein